MKQHWDQNIDPRDPTDIYYQPHLDAHDHNYTDLPVTWFLNEIFNDEG